MAKSIIPDVIEAASNRRSFVRKLGIAGAAVGAMGIASEKLEAAGPTAVDMEVLNFALNLEYLESEFYSYAVDGMPITAFGIGIDGMANGMNPTTGGYVMGGAKVTFSNDLVFAKELAAEIGSDERAHVKLLRGALGSNAIAQPNINLNALGFGFGSENDFLKLSRIFEDIGVTAYAGAASLLSTAVITTAAQILAAEAEHVSAVRMNIARLNIPTMALDSVDLIPPPSGTQSQYLSINVSNGLASTRSAAQVLYLAFDGPSKTEGGFFPTGVNGAITMSSAMPA